jgi:hypothetical protein
MAEAQIIDGPISRNLEKPVQIAGLDYIFRSSRPALPGHFQLNLSVPNWAEQEALLKEHEKERTIQQFMLSELASRKLTDGRVAYADIDGVFPDDGAPAVNLSMIESTTAYLPTESDYHDARGLGSFLLNSLCDMADSQGWRVYLFPVDKGGRLRQHELYQWYRRKGFVDPHEVPDAMRLHGMVRLPRLPRTNTIKL